MEGSPVPDSNVFTVGPRCVIGTGVEKTVIAVSVVGKTCLFYAVPKTAARPGAGGWCAAWRQEPNVPVGCVRGKAGLV